MAKDIDTAAQVISIRQAFLSKSYSARLVHEDENMSVIKDMMMNPHQEMALSGRVLLIRVQGGPVHHVSPKGIRVKKLELLEGLKVRSQDKALRILSLIHI